MLDGYTAYYKVYDTTELDINRFKSKLSTVKKTIAGLLGGEVEAGLHKVPGLATVMQAEFYVADLGVTVFIDCVNTGATGYFEDGGIWVVNVTVIEA